MKKSDKIIETNFYNSVDGGLWVFLVVWMANYRPDGDKATRGLHI